MEPITAPAAAPPLAPAHAPAAAPATFAPPSTAPRTTRSPVLRLGSPASSVQRSAKARDRKSTRLNSSHVAISYAVFCLKKKKKDDEMTQDMVNYKVKDELSSSKEQR